MAAVEVGDQPREGRVIEQVAPDDGRIESANPEIDEGVARASAHFRIEPLGVRPGERRFRLRVVDHILANVASSRQTGPVQPLKTSGRSVAARLGSRPSTNPSFARATASPAASRDSLTIRTEAVALATPLTTAPAPSPLPPPRGGPTLINSLREFPVYCLTKSNSGSDPRPSTNTGS